MRAAAREVVRLRDQLARLGERLALQEGDLHGAGEDVARGMDVQAGTIYCGPAVINSTGAGQIQNSGAMGAIALALDLASTPTPTGLVAVQVGEVWNFTAWFRDSLGGVAMSNFADGYEVTFE